MRLRPQINLFDLSTQVNDPHLGTLSVLREAPSEARHLRYKPRSPSEARRIVAGDLLDNFDG